MARPGNAVILSIDASATSVCSITSGVVTFTGAGSCVIDANQAGNVNYNPAAQVQQTVPVGKGAQTIVFTSAAPTGAVVGGPTYTPTASGGVSGNEVIFSIDASATSVCSITSGVVTFTGAGSCVIDANQAGNANFNAAAQVQQAVSVVAVLGSQSISFTSIAPTGAVVGGPTYTPMASGGGSGNAVVLSIDASATSACSISSGVVSFTAVGSCVIDANQAGNAEFSPAPQVQQTVLVEARPDHHLHLELAHRSRDRRAHLHPDGHRCASGNPVIFSIDASATSVCSITGGVVSFAAAGSCVIDANQAGNANYNPAPRVQQAVSVVAVLGAPTGLRATAGVERIKLSWIAPADHGGSSVIGYRVYRGTSPGGESATPLATLPRSNLFHRCGRDSRGHLLLRRQSLQRRRQFGTIGRGPRHGHGLRCGGLSPSCQT